MGPQLKHCKRWVATEGIDKAVKEHEIDKVVSVSDSFFAVSVGARKFVNIMRESKLKFDIRIPLSIGATRLHEKQRRVLRFACSGSEELGNVAS